jgi:probable rRNA maturation factor
VSAAPTISIDLRIEDERWGSLGDLEALSRRALEAASKRTGEAGEVAILLTNDAEMRALNKQWRQIDKATDVLSFPSGGPEIPGELRHLGDIAIGHETAMHDAETMNRPITGHFSHLLIHGFLHLIGYDHIEPEDAAVMEPLEADILAQLGWPDPYATGPYAGERG